MFYQTSDFVAVLFLQASTIIRMLAAISPPSMHAMSMYKDQLHYRIYPLLTFSRSSLFLPCHDCSLARVAVRQCDYRSPDPIHVKPKEKKCVFKQLSRDHLPCHGPLSCNLMGEKFNTSHSPENNMTKSNQHRSHVCTASPKVQFSFRSRVKAQNEYEQAV